MAGPWESYQQSPTTTAAPAPWEDYTSAQKGPTSPQEEGNSFTSAMSERPWQTFAGVIPGVAEAVAGGLVGLGEEAIAGVAGLGTASIGGGFEKGYGATKEALSPLSEAIVPETVVGKGIATVLNKIPEAFHDVGVGVFNATGSPLAATITETSLNAAALLFPTKGASKLKNATRDNLKELLHNPSQSLIDKDIALNKMLGGENETISARVGKAKDTSLTARVLAKGLNSLDPGHTDRAMADVNKFDFAKDMKDQTENLTNIASKRGYKDVNDFAINHSEEFKAAAGKWRDNHPIPEVDQAKEEIKNHANAILNEPDVIGKGDQTLKTVRVDELPSTSEQITKSIQEWTLANTKDSSLKQTGFRRNDTGEIEPSGPAHDDAKKADTSTYEQGFIDAQGSFHNRHDAHEIAEQSGQIPENQALEHPQEGLHSGDLRKAGSEDFLLTKSIKDTPHPASIASKEEFDARGKQILREHGPEAAQKFAKDVTDYQKKHDVPVPKSEPELADSLHNLDTQGSADRSGAVSSYEAMEKDGIDSNMQKRFLDHQEGHGNLTPHEIEAYEKYIGPARDELKAQYERQVKLNRAVAEEFLPDYHPRIRLWDPNKSAWKNFVERMTRQEGAFADKVGEEPTIFEKRTLFALEGEAGSRSVIQKVGKSIYEWKNGKRSDKPIAYGIEDIKSAIFKGKTLKEASVDELHAHTPYRYLQDAAMINSIKLNELRKYDRAANFLDAWKSSEMFAKVATNDASHIPKGWVTPKSVARIPQLMGYAFEPKTAWVVEDFAKHFENGMYMKLTSALIKNMMLNPLPHIFNEAMHLVVARGLSAWFRPSTLKSFTETGSQAMMDVWNQSDLYREVMREGGSIMSSDLRANHFHDIMMDKAAKEAYGEISNIAKRAGMAPTELYQGIISKSNHAMWMVRDAMYLQLIRETKLRTSVDTKEAIKQVEKHMPNYRVPTTVAGSRKLSTVLQNPNVSVFSKYHYGLVNSMAHVVKEMHPKNLMTHEGQAEFRKGLDSALAYAFGMTIFYPMMDQMAQIMFGDPTMEQRRAGPFHILEAIKRVSEGEADTQALLAPIFTFNPVLLAGGQLAFNRILYSGRHVYESNDPAGKIAGDVAKYAEHSIPQAGAILDANKYATLESGTKAWAARQIDIKGKSEKQVKLEKRAKAILEQQRKQRLKKYESENK